MPLGFLWSVFLFGFVGGLNVVTLQGLLGLTCQLLGLTLQLLSLTAQLLSHLVLRFYSL